MDTVFHITNVVAAIVGYWFIAAVIAAPLIGRVLRSRRQSRHAR
jgi:hypothetical protein